MHKLEKAVKKDEEKVERARAESASRQSYVGEMNGSTAADGDRYSKISRGKANSDSLKVTHACPMASTAHRPEP